MAKFCGKCGSKLDEATGLCPNCQADALNKKKGMTEPQPAAKSKVHEKSAKKEKSCGKKKKTCLVILALAVVVLVTAAVLIVPRLLASQEEGDYDFTSPDADAYYEDNSYVVSVIDAKESRDVHSEADVIQLLEDRGFDQYAIETEYNMDGQYSEAAEISDSSVEKHPIYYTYYVNGNDELWMIYVINGSVMATPVSYNFQSSLDVQVTFSESEKVTSYDSTTNRFYVTIPDESALIVKVVDRIDADTLEWLTIEEIDYYG